MRRIHSEKEMSFFYRLKMFFGRIKKGTEELYEVIAINKNLTALNSLKQNVKNTKQRCFVVGNGPSLNNLDLTLLKDEFVIGSNSIYLNKLVSCDIIVVEDRLVFEDSISDIVRSVNSPIICPHDLKNKTLQKAIGEKILWIPFQRVLGRFKKRNFVKRNNLLFFWGGTVTYLSLQIAYYLGFDEIVLIGMDMSYTIPSDATISGSVITSNSEDPNHFNGSYFGKGKRWHLPDTERMQRNLERARNILEGEGIKVVNATCGGNLKGYTRVDFNALFK